VPDALLVVDRASQAAAAFARSFGAELAHSEYSMTLRRAPAPEEVRHPELVARPAVPDDGAFVRLCIGLAFEGTNDATRDPIGGAPLDVSDPDRATVIFELAGSRVGMVAISHSERGSYISGFSMLPECRGRGFGRQMLARVVGDLLSTGYDRISLEVATSNDRALELYRTNGFEVVVTLDYYNVPL
jgi:ribosomal protein S18 acetylase RimI-like enzyme